MPFTTSARIRALHRGAHDTARAAEERGAAEHDRGDDREKELFAGA